MKYIGWISGALGALLMLFGVIAFFSGEFLTVKNHFNYFYIANSFLFLGIFCFLCDMNCKNKEDK
ncbi:MAG: hypothetical protein K8R58_06480 [Bacteroidales bacterium]|nr:hypothetical protein [Bacteroidales bacterium]